MLADLETLDGTVDKVTTLSSYMRLNASQAHKVVEVGSFGRCVPLGHRSCVSMLRVPVLLVDGCARGQVHPCCAVHRPCLGHRLFLTDGGVWGTVAQVWRGAFDSLRAEQLLFLLFLANYVLSHERGKDQFLPAFSRVCDVADAR